ncbi:hypothetical protein [Spartinivicinus ruber]|uniref:hypothetical protein n=1 Tax=Spartinivicinus ruber TaxID=2683272 RepID=UPI0013D6129E|nr:hypothetical protein [Spartinivicinus ruber]
MKLIKWLKLLLCHFRYSHKYTIVDFLDDSFIAVIRCLDTRVVLRLNIEEVIANKGIISHLLPEQACFVGIKYAFALKYGFVCQSTVNHYTADSTISFDCHHNVQFVHPISSNNIVLPAEEIAAAKELINLFNPVGAYLIGVEAGKQKLNKQFLPNSFANIPIDNLF